MIGFLSVAVLASSFALAIWLLGRERTSPVTLMLGWLSLTFVLRPALMVMDIAPAQPASFFSGKPETQIALSALYVGIWLSGFAFGFASLAGPGAFVARIFPVWRIMPTRLGLIVPTAIATAFALAGAAQPLIKTGFNFAAAQRMVRLEQFFSGASYIQSLPTISGTFAAICIVFELFRRKTGDRSAPFLISSVFLLILSFAANWTFGDRSGIVWPLLLLMLGLLVVYPKVNSFAAAGGMVALVLVATSLHRIRADQFQNTYSADYYGNAGVSITRGLNLNNYDAFLLAIRDFQGAETKRNGEDFANAFLGLVPRALWPDKPQFINVGDWFAQVYKPGKVSGTPVTLLGEWFLNFGILGLVVGGTLSGSLYRGIILRYPDYRTNPLVFMTVISVVFNITAFGASNNLPRKVVLFGAPLLAFIFVAEYISKRSRGPRQLRSSATQLPTAVI